MYVIKENGRKAVGFAVFNSKTMFTGVTSLRKRAVEEAARLFDGTPPESASAWWKENCDKLNLEIVKVEIREIWT